MVQENILIRIRAIDEATQTIKQVSGSLKQLSVPMTKMNAQMGNAQRTIIRTYKPAAQGIQSMGDALQVAGLSQNKFNQYARLNFLQVQKGGVVMDRLTGQITSYGVAVKQAALQSRRFKFEWLSIMFAGMALDRAFGGLVRTQLELFGVTDLMGDAWTVVLLPVMEKIVPLIYDLLEAFMDMPEWLKLAMGGFVLFGAMLGTILTTVGQVVLALMGFKLLEIGDKVVSFKQVGFGKLKTNLNWALKIAAAGILLAIAYDDLKSGKEIAALGDALMATGILLKGGKWLIPVGLTLKLLGDEEFVVKTIKFFFALGQLMSEIISLSIKTGLGIPITEKDMPSLTNFRSAWDKAIEQLTIEERDIFGDTPPRFPTETIKSFEEAERKLQDLWLSGEIGTKEFKEKLGELEIEYSDQIEWIDKWKEAMDDWKESSIDDVNEVKNALAGIRITPWGYGEKNIFGVFGKLAGYQQGGIVPRTGPALLHAGEMVTPRHEVGAANQTTISPVVTYNINVSDKTEMERLMKENNLKLVEEIKRRINI